MWCDGCGIELHHDAAPSCGVHEWCLPCWTAGETRCRRCEQVRAEVDRLDEDTYRGGER